MPLYEYQCKECGQFFEKMVRFSEADTQPICPICDSSNTEKLVSKVSAFGVSFNAGTSSSSSCGSHGGFS